MGDGLKRVAKRHGGLTVKDSKSTVHYNGNGDKISVQPTAPIMGVGHSTVTYPDAGFKNAIKSTEEVKKERAEQVQKVLSQIVDTMPNAQFLSLVIFGEKNMDWERVATILKTWFPHTKKDLE